jgi:hypothetical protein
MPPRVMYRETVANRAPKHAQSFSGDPKNCLPNQGSVIAVLIGRGTMTKLDVDDARPFVGMIPGDRVSACGVVGCQAAGDGEIRNGASCHSALQLP